MVTNWYSTGGPGPNDYFEPKNFEIEQYLGVKIFLNHFIYERPPFYGAGRGGSQFIPHIFFYGFLFSMTSRSQMTNKIVLLNF